MSAKRERSTALRNFTRNLNLLSELFDESAGNALVTPQFEKVKSCWEKLEDAHDKFMSTVDDSSMDLDTDPEGYLYIDDATGKYNKVLKRYSAYLKWFESTQRDDAEKKRKEEENEEREINRKLAEDREVKETQLRKAEKREKFESAAAELMFALDSFCRVNEDIEESLSDAAVSDKRRDWEIVQSEFSSLKEQVIAVAGIDPSGKMSEINRKFAAKTERSFCDAKK